MKVLYSVQATGNGHISRANQILPYLREYGDIDVFLSGDNATLPVDFDVKYRSKGLSLYYNSCGNLDKWETAKAMRFGSLLREARSLPVDDYDLVINDFESITSLACYLKKKASVHFGHQASFTSPHVPRPKSKNLFGEFVLKNYARSTSQIGLHFESYDDHIYPAIIKDEFIDARPENHGHISVYLPAYDPECLRKYFKNIAPKPVHWFLKDIDAPFVEDNIHYFPVNKKYFNDSMIYCEGLLTGGGFETPAEALFLGKKLLSIPIKDHYEQQCNAAALKKLGVPVLEDLNDDNVDQFYKWVAEPQKIIPVLANNIKVTLDAVFATLN